MSHSVGSIRQNMPMPENLTALHSRMLLEIFGVREEKRRPPVVSCMGRGYDIIHDEIKVLGGPPSMIRAICRCTG